ncbi:hypothetical protein TB1_032489 [Malus domestica]
MVYFSVFYFFIKKLKETAIEGVDLKVQLSSVYWRMASAKQANQEAVQGNLKSLRMDCAETKRFSTLDVVGR